MCDKSVWCKVLWGKYEKAVSLKDSEFKLLMGVTKVTAKEMIRLLA
jgi:hypothetical protein